MHHASEPGSIRAMSRDIHDCDIEGSRQIFEWRSQINRFRDHIILGFSK